MKTHQNLKNITTDASIEEIQYVENVGLNSNSYEAIPEAAKTTVPSKHVQKKLSMDLGGDHMKKSSSRNQIFCSSLPKTTRQNNKSMVPNIN